MEMIMTIQTEIVIEDWRAYSKFIYKHATLGGNGRTKALILYLCFCVAIGLMISVFKISINLLSVLIGFFGMALIVGIYSRWQLKNLQPAPDGIVLGKCTIAVSDEGIKTSTAIVESSFSWKAIRRAEISDEHIFVMVDNVAAIIVPKRSFASDTEREQFLAEIQSHSNS